MITFMICIAINCFRINRSRIMRWVEHMARTGERIHVFQVLVKKYEEKLPFGRHRSRWKDNIKWILRYGQVAGSCEHGNENSGSGLAENRLAS